MKNSKDYLEKSIRFSLKKLLLIMKLSVILVLYTCFQVSAVVKSQTVTLSVADVSVKEVLKEINKQTGYNFFFSDEILATPQKITLDMKEVPIGEALEICFKDLPIDFKIVENTIMLMTSAEREKNQDRQLNQQDRVRISGTITDPKGNPLEGVAVFVPGTSVGTNSDKSGNYSLDVPRDAAQIEVRFVGIKTQVIPISGRTTINVTMIPEIVDLDEVQIIAYGQTTKRLNTSTISTVKGSEVVSRPVTNVLQALQGQVAGVSFHQQATGAGSPIEIVVRGQNSFTSGTNPLIIVDGVIVNQDPGGLISGGSAATTIGGSNFMVSGVSPLNFINPSDIESVDILKDADATSIYGSRASNGVILITTKKAVLGKVKFTFNASAGVSAPTGTIKRMGTEDYLQMRRDALAMGNATSASAINPITPDNYNAPDLTRWDQTAYTDWNDYEIGNTAPVYDFSGQATGGNKFLNFLASVGYFKKYDVQVGNPNQERMVGRLALGHTSADNKFVMNLSSRFGFENQEFSNSSMSSNNVSILANAPNYEIYNEDGSLYFPFEQHAPGTYINPVPMENVSANSSTGNLLISADISYEIIRGLRAKMLVSYNLQDNEFHKLFPSTAMSVQTEASYPEPFGQHTTNKFKSFNLEPMMTYDTRIAKGDLKLLAGGTILDRENSMTGVTVKNPGNDALLSSYGSGNPTTANSNNTYYKFSSLFGRLTYEWDRKYVANLTYRRDGSSRFGPNMKFGNFGSAGLGWIFSQEKFFSNALKVMNFGKLRGSFGTTGSDNIGDYLYTSLMQSAGFIVYAGQPILRPASLPNPEIHWEKTTKMDVGMELGFIESRIQLNATWYRTNSDNMIVDESLPSQTGFSSYTGNFAGSVQNTGMEFQLNTNNLEKSSPLKWKSSFNISFNKNELTKFPDLESSRYATTYEIGRAIPASSGVFGQVEMPYRFKGIDPANGMPMFEDINNDGIIDYLDYGVNEAWIGTSRPTSWGGLGNYFTYKGFGLDFFIQFSEQMMTRWDYSNSLPTGSISNPSVDVTGNYWKQPGDVTKYPRLYTGLPGEEEYTTPISQYYPQSDAGIVHGFYYRLKNVQLTYTLPQSTVTGMGVENMMFYIRGENLAVYTREKLHKDPEPFWPNTSPMLRTFVAGVQLTF